MERVFAMEPGEVSVLAEGGRVFLVRLDAALPPDPDDPQTALISQVLAEQAAQGIAQDVYEAFARAVQARAGIELDQSAISAVHSSLQLQ
jgi:peptidyl-prolyl cis-trans isomerase D